MNVALAVQEETRSVAPWIAKGARVGYAAKGLLYLVSAALAIAAALDHRRPPAAGSRRAVTTLLDAPLGQALVAVIAVGFAAYGVWRIVMAIADAEDDGTSAKGIVMRIVDAIHGIVHLAFAYTAGAIAFGHHHAATKAGHTEKKLSAEALAIPGGRYVLFGVAIGIAIYGLYQLYCAVACKLGKRLDLSRMGASTGRAVVAVCRFGIAARALVFLALAFLLGRTAYHRNPAEAGGVPEAASKLFELGFIPCLAIASGLAAYGIYELIEARYRRINVT